MIVTQRIFQGTARQDYTKVLAPNLDFRKAGGHGTGAKTISLLVARGQCRTDVERRLASFWMVENLSLAVNRAPQSESCESAQDINLTRIAPFAKTIHILD